MHKKNFREFRASGNRPETNYLNWLDINFSIFEAKKNMTTKVRLMLIIVLYIAFKIALYNSWIAPVLFLPHNY